MNRFAIVLMLVSLLAAAAVLSRQGPRGVDKAKPQARQRDQLVANLDEGATAESHWARALIVRMEFSLFEYSPQDEVLGEFVRALSSAENRAPIYVSLAGELYLDDEDELPRRVSEVAAEDTFVTEHSKVACTRNENLDQLVRFVFEDVRRRGGRETALQELLELTSHRHVPSAEIFCLAALSVDPDYLPAWYQLSLSDEWHTFGLDGWRRRDPLNGFVDYVAAVRRQKAGNFDELQSLIRQGNGKPSCRHYPSELPKRIHLRYGNDANLPFWKIDESHVPDFSLGAANSREVVEQVNDLLPGVNFAGRRIPWPAFASLKFSYDALWSFADSLPGEFRQTFREFIEHSRELVRKGDREGALESLQDSYLFGLRLMRCEPLEMRFTVGTSGLAMTLEVLEEIADPVRDVELHKKLKEMSERQSQSLDRLIHGIDEIQPKTNRDVIAIMLGHRNLADDDLRVTREALSAFDGVSTRIIPTR